MNAPEIHELISWIKKPEIKAVIIREFSRLIRMDDFTGFKLFNEFADSKTKIYYPGGEIDFSTSQGKIIGSLLGVLGGIEKQELKLKTWESKERKRELGLDASGPVTWPAGIAFDKKTNQWHWTDEIEKVRRAFRLFLSGDTSFSSIEEKTGLTRYNLRTIFSNRIYTGYRVIDTMRNPAKEARYASKDGRQSSRRKMCRPKPIVVHRPELVHHHRRGVRTRPGDSAAQKTESLAAAHSPTRRIRILCIAASSFARSAERRITRSRP